MSYEKARIKLLDKNTGQVLKEVDPFTSAEAVTCFDGETAQKKFDDMLASINKDENDILGILSDIVNIKTKDTDQDSFITSILSKNTEQDDRLNSIEIENSAQEIRIEALMTKNGEQDTRLDSMQGTLNSHESMINDVLVLKNTEQDNRLTSLETNVSSQGTKITNIQNTLTTMQTGSPVKLFVRPTDPGTTAAVNDVWMDTANNVFKYKTSSGTWKMIGAAYN